jgi:DNA-binding CsgD family transcriptional regulator
MKMETSSATASKHSATASQLKATGLVVFNTSGQLLFMNQEAQLYIRQLQTLTTRENGTSLIPEDVLGVFRELLEQLMRCDHPKDCETVQVERICLRGDQKLLLRGFCIPYLPLPRNSQLLVFMERLHQKLEYPDTDIQQLYHLTGREQMVIMYLMLGFTNKEIASRMNLSEYTVKEHLKRIMQKTKTNTRTGLMARMIFPDIHDRASLRASPKDSE